MARTDQIRHGCIAVAAMTLPAAGVAHGAAPPDQSIVVTAPIASDSVSLNEAPVNMQVIGSDAIARRQPQSLADLLDGTIGSISLSNGTGSPYQSDVNYRGFQATSLLGAPTGLSVWIDGVRMNEPFGAIVNWDLIPLNALSQVEVQPGANPLFGLNTLGGSLVLTTRNGRDDPGLMLTAKGGSFARRGAELTAGGVSGDRRLDWFVAGTFDDQDGYRQFTHTRVAQGYGKLRWRGNASHAELGLIWADTALSGTQGLPLSMLGTPQAAYTAPDRVANRQMVVNLKADTRLSAALKLSGNLYYRRSASHSVNSNASLGDPCDAGTLDCSALAPGGTARDLDDPGLPVHDYTSGINTTLVDANLAQHTFGGHLLADFDGMLAGLGHDLNLGGSFEAATIGYDQSTVLARLIDRQTVAEIANPRYAPAPGLARDPLIGAAGLASHALSFDLFVHDSLHLTSKLTLTASLTWIHTRLSLDGANTTLLGADGAWVWTGADGSTRYNPAYLGALYQNDAGALVPATAPEGGVPGPEAIAISGRHAYSRINPALGLAWNPSHAVGLFASYSEAMRAPTAIEFACADPARPCALPTGFNGDPDLRAVIAHSIEAGARGTVHGTLRWNTAVWSTLVDNDIQFIFASSGLGHFANLGRTRRQGFELGLATDWGRVSLTAGYGHVIARYRQGFVDAQGDAVAPGAHIPGIPADSVKLGATWRPLDPLRLGVTWVITGRQFAHGDEANRDAPVPGYGVVNLDLHYDPTRRMGLFATVTNLTDTHYSTYGVWGSNIYNGATEQFRTPAPGRAVLTGLTLRF